MKKDAYYFPHFCNARHDRKLKRVQKELGIEGYGIYFMLLEILREQDEFKYPMEDIDLLADEFGTSEQKITTVVSNYKLFNVDNDENFFSIKLHEYMQPYLTMKEQRRQAGIKSGKVRKLTAKTPEEKISELCQVYIIECWGNDERFIKIGATNGAISRRFSGKLPYSYKVLRQIFIEGDYYSVETEIHSFLSNFKHIPGLKFSGCMECYDISCKVDAIKYVPKNSFSHEHCLNENEQSKVKKSKEKKSIFKKPTIEEIKNYCLERKNNIDPESFFHFYESKDWKIGKNKMKNWKSAMITWEKKNKPAQEEKPMYATLNR